MNEGKGNSSDLGAIIAAAGASRRMGGVDKLFALIAGRPLLAWTVEPFHRCPAVRYIILVVQEQHLDQARALARAEGWHKVSQVCAGGERRQDSVAQGLKELPSCSWVAVHDGARPCISIELIERALAEAGETGAAVPALPLTDTIKVVGPEGIVRETPPRATLWAAQTPQVFRCSLLRQAYTQASQEASDDATLVERLGHPVRLFPGSADNIKVTTPQDLALAEIILRKRYAH